MAPLAERRVRFSIHRAKPETSTSSCTSHHITFRHRKAVDRTNSSCHHPNLIRHWLCLSQRQPRTRRCIKRRSIPSRCIRIRSRNNCRPASLRTILGERWIPFASPTRCLESSKPRRMPLHIPTAIHRRHRILRRRRRNLHPTSHSCVYCLAWRYAGYGNGKPSKALRNSPCRHRCHLHGPRRRSFVPILRIVYRRNGCHRQQRYSYQSNGAIDRRKSHGHRQRMLACQYLCHVSVLYSIEKHRGKVLARSSSVLVVFGRCNIDGHSSFSLYNAS